MTEIHLSIIPAEGVTDAYAAASGDHNPIHLDEAFALSVGLPGRILHGLWTAAQVARAATQAAPEGALIVDGDGAIRYGLASLNVAFRGMGVIGPEIVVSGRAEPGEDGTVAVKLDAVQDGGRLIRGARASLRAGSGPEGDLSRPD